MGFKKRLGGSSFLLFSALCGIAGSSVASAAGAEERNVAAEKENLANKEADDVDDGDINVGLDEGVIVENEARNIAGSVAKMIIITLSAGGLIGGAAFLAMSQEARKKVLDYVLVQSGILDKIEEVKKQTPDLEKMIDEMYAKKEAEREEKQKEQEAADREEFKADVEALIITAGPRKKSVRWILKVFGVSLPKTAEGSRALAIVRDLLFVCGEDSNSVVFNVLYFVAMALWLVNSIVLVYKDPDIMSKDYWFKSPFMMKKANQGSVWKHRVPVAIVQLVDGALSFVFPGWAFLRQSLNALGSLGSWLMEKPEAALAPGGAGVPVKQADLLALNNRVGDLVNKVDALEVELKTLNPGSPNNFAAVKNELDAIKAQIGGLPKGEDVMGLAGRVNALENQIGDFPKKDDVGAAIGQVKAEFGGRLNNLNEEVNLHGQVLNRLNGNFEFMANNPGKDFKYNKGAWLLSLKDEA